MQSYNENPLLSDSPQVWDELIAAMEPASLLVVIESRMSRRLLGRQAAEDILQDALLHAWRDRARCTWRGLKSFRAWLLSIIDHRINDVADHGAAQKRGGGVTHMSLTPEGEVGLESRSSGQRLFPCVSTTPSRVAMYREHAAAMQAALVGLPPELSEVVRLRLFEQLSLEEIATHLRIGVSAVRHRFRRGAELYQRRLSLELASRSGAPLTDLSTP